MHSSHRFKMITLAFSGLFIGLLATQITGSPRLWIKMALLDFLRMNLSVMQASPLETSDLRAGSLLIAKGVRPAAKGESPEDAELKKQPSPIPPGQLRRPSKAELLDKCGKNAHCKAKLQKAQQRGPNKPLPPAQEESPQDKELKNLPKAHSPRGPHQSSDGNFLMPEDNQPLLSWLNPFQVAPAYAQSGVSTFLTPAGPYTNNSYLTLYGARVYYNGRYRFVSADPFNYLTTENNPFAYLRFSVPTTGTYLINVQASNGKAKIRHLSNGPIIDSWDFTAEPYGTYDYLTAEYLAQGYHSFYFWPDEGSSFYFYSASLESYP